MPCEWHDDCPIVHLRHDVHNALGLVIAVDHEALYIGGQARIRISGLAGPIPPMLPDDLLALYTVIERVAEAAKAHRPMGSASVSQPRAPKRRDRKQALDARVA